MIKTREELLRVIPVINMSSAGIYIHPEMYHKDPRQQSLHCWQTMTSEDFYTGPSVGTIITLEEAIVLYNKLHFNEEFIEKI